MAKMTEVVRALEKLGLAVQVLPAPYPGINVWSEPPALGAPQDTVWPPRGDQADWIWGPSFNHSTRDTDAATVAAKVAETLRSA